MRLMLEYSEFSEVNAESATRTKKLTEERFLEILYKYCKNFSFENDQLWRNANQSFGQFGIFFEKDRARTIGTYSYKDFFDERCGYLVPRYKSLIGSTDIKGSDIFGSGSRNYLVIPFDDANIIISGSPDLAFWSKCGQVFSDDLFILTKYTQNYKVPVSELREIQVNSKLGYRAKLLDLGFEFFTNSNCLLLDESKIDWLKNLIS